MNKRKIKLIPIKEILFPIKIPTYQDLGESTKYNLYIPRCRHNCSNHPFNGSSGICCCCLPYLETSNQTTTYTYFNGIIE